MNVTVHVDHDTHALLSDVQLALAKQFRAEGKPYTIELLRHMAYSLALERGAELLADRHCNPDAFTLDPAPSPPEHDPVATARKLQALYGKTEPQAQA